MREKQNPFRERQIEQGYAASSVAAQQYFTRVYKADKGNSNRTYLLRRHGIILKRCDNFSRVRVEHSPSTALVAVRDALFRWV